VNYFVLLNLAGKSDITTAAKSASIILSNLKKAASQEPRQIWADGAYYGYAVVFSGTARDLWVAACNTLNERLTLKDILIVELGRDWCARNESPADAWLNSHLGSPIPYISHVPKN
jgi:hypothetical protein